MEKQANRERIIEEVNLHKVTIYMCEISLKQSIYTLKNEGQEGKIDPTQGRYQSAGKQRG
jgi:hypothetical protein